MSAFGGKADTSFEGAMRQLLFEIKKLGMDRIIT